MSLQIPPVPWDTPPWGEGSGMPAPWRGFWTRLRSFFSSSLAVTAPTVLASPFTYTNGGTSPQQALVSGTITSVQFGRAGTFYTVATGAPVMLSSGDQLKITYPGAAPVLQIVPL